jgi:hypothetical protein
MSFENFLSDMGVRPENTTLDRIHNDLGYSPGNCRWVSRSNQQNNRRCNVVVEFQGRTQTLAQWAREVGLPFSTIRYRLRKGWPVERALTEKSRKSAG